MQSMGWAQVSWSKWDIPLKVDDQAKILWNCQVQTDNLVIAEVEGSSDRCSNIRMKEHL